MNREKSKNITLIVLGTSLLSLFGCSDNQEINQSTYNTNEECIKDWGNDPSRCSKTPNGSYVGPMYYWDHHSGIPMIYNSHGNAVPATNSFMSKGYSSSAVSTNKTTTSISRGGFGSSAHSSFSAGG